MEVEGLEAAALFPLQMLRGSGGGEEESSGKEMVGEEEWMLGVGMGWEGPSDRGRPRWSTAAKAGEGGDGGLREVGR